MKHTQKYLSCISGDRTKQKALILYKCWYNETKMYLYKWRWNEQAKHADAVFSTYCPRLETCWRPQLSSPSRFPLLRLHNCQSLIHEAVTPLCQFVPSGVYSSALVLPLQCFASPLPPCCVLCPVRHPPPKTPVNVTPWTCRGMYPCSTFQTPSTGLRHPSFNHCRI